MLPTCADRREALHVDLANLARRHLDRRVARLPWRPAAPTIRRCARSARPCPASAPRCAAACRAGCSSAAARCPAGCRRSARRRSCRRPSGRPAAGCSASRRPRRSAARCAPSGSGRTRSSTTFAGMSSLSRLKSMMRYIRLCPPPRHQDVSCPCVVAAAGAVQRLDQRLVRLLRRDLVEDLHGLKPGAGRRRFEFANWHDYAPSRNSGIFAPSRSFT